MAAPSTPATGPSATPPTLVPDSTRPWPIGRSRHQSTADRVVVNVGHLLGQFASAKDIAVVSATVLPEMLRPPTVADPLQYLRSKLTPATQDQGGKWTFERPQQPRHRNLRKFRSKEQVHVLGHNHPGVQIESAAATNKLEMVGEGRLDGIAAKQRQPMVAGVRQVPGMALVLVPLQRSPQWPCHIGIIASSSI